MKIDENRYRTIKLGALCGILGIFIFFGVAVLLEQLFWQDKLKALNINTTKEFLNILGTNPYSQIIMGGHLLIGLAMLLFAVGFIGLFYMLSIEKKSIFITIGTIFGVIACAIMTEMSIIQGTVMVKLGNMFIGAKNDIQKESIVAVYRGLRCIDWGLDLAFDFFFFSAWILLGIAMLKNKNLGKILGFVGIILFTITAVLNIWAAPDPAIIELAPICCLWILMVYIQMLRSMRAISKEVNL